MEWYYWILTSLVYFFGCGAILSYLLNREYEGLANADSETILFSSLIWPVSIWFIIGCAWMRRIIEGGYIR